MSKSSKVAAGGVVVGIALIWIIGFWPALLVMVGVPVAAYLMLDKTQRRRLQRITRKELGR
ncbi:hypothetical protein GCM10010329_58620 [Streptomyces spiroverticillatus]|uniref:Uncharacterized protein n=1 Tax=Streptomyces finlayi TaxID=67296 RepID=A0A919CD54_9ACTN|nr:hypothetical protein [Streptomyces finlayi]GHA27623.1 hypothetical protein GCM10010329_58620 [Streptomyces spiroverticillatus]GHD08707.1 hypothetical protein GCM10010334_62280 [Streptomyces finlayi]